MCGAVGSNADQTIPRRADDFYLNIAEPASCSGIINYFTYCYYRPQTEDSPSYLFTFAIYRESSPGSGVYSTVSSVFVAERTLSDITTELGGGNFACVNLTVNDPVSVEVGDVLGACISDPPGDIQELEVVGIVLNSRVLLYGVDGCTPNAVPSMVSNPVTETTFRVLHLYSNIGK